MRVFAHITNNDNKVVNVFDWGEDDIEPNLGNEHTMIDITLLEVKPQVGFVYNSSTDEFTAPSNMPSMPLSELKDLRIKALKINTELYITNRDNYPYYKQINLLNQIDSTEDTIEKKNTMITFIQDTRETSRTREASITNATTSTAVMEVSINFP